MEWSNEKILQFVELFQTEPCLWDPQHKSHKNRGAQNDAWCRIVDILPFPATDEDLKKKKETLMGYYRFHLNKYKKSLMSGSGTNDVYTTNWFAFHQMNSFLKPIYESNITINTESENLLESDNSGGKESPVSVPQCEKQFSGKQSYSKNKLPPEITAVKKQMDEAFDSMMSMQQKKSKGLHDTDEFEHFALMIASKLRKIDHLDLQEALMNNIQQLVYQTMITNMNRKTSSCASSTALLNNTQDHSYSVVSETNFETIEIDVSPHGLTN